MTDDRPAQTPAQPLDDASHDLLMAALTASGHHWAWECDAALRFTRFTDGFALATGLDPAEFIGQNSVKVRLRGISPDSVVRHVADIEARRPFRDFSYCIRDPRGKAHHFTISGIPFFDAEGRFAGYRGIGSESTAHYERRLYIELLERAKAESDRRVKAIFNGVGTFVMLMLIDGAVVEINRAALSFRGLAREQVTGEPLWDGPWFGDQQAARAAIRDAAETAALGEATALDLEFANEAGARHVFAVSCKPVRSAGGDVHYVLLEAHDMTEFVTMQARNRELELEVMHGQKMESLGTLAGGIAHEINTPMQYIGDNLTFVRDSFADIAIRLTEAAGALDEDTRYLVEEIPAALSEGLEGVERVRRIVGAVKEFSYPDSGQKGWADLARALETTATVSRNQWKYVADLAFDIEPGLPPVFCELGEINQVILNLIVNAAHAIEERNQAAPETAALKGLITLSLKREGDAVVLGVADTGAGIRPEHRDKIFDLFFTTKPPGRGTGQGLSICQSIVVRRHGGRIAVETEVGRGTVFRVQLPIRGPGCESADDGQQQAA
ncbi:PAS domain-containing sensor histidine kinase [Azospirillum agricola]|uniref:PAS domain-containing sensor histidine kinase n=1 Tax=Azospirillum agricola TaxID=1720247 RepID=UPI000A0F17D6|nr:ATP-binding protein [Azospirillum agricola]SMH62234.1 PAS domain S-box-containing protein [Azospirillum lipoferum]